MARVGDGWQGSVRGRWMPVAILFALGLLFFVSAASAEAAVGPEVVALTPVDRLTRSETPLADGGMWAPLAGATGTGGDAGTGWSPGGEYPSCAGAYWNTGLSEKTGSAAAVDLAALPGSAGRSGSLWIDMPTPASAKSGYELRWTADPSGGTYTVTLSAWSNGSATVLATNAGVSLTAGATMAVADTGPSATAWSGTNGTLSELLTAESTAYAGGYTGIAACGPLTRLKNFREGAVPLAPAVASVGAAAPEATTATLSAEIDPNGSATSYQFEYGPTASYGTDVPVPAAAVGNGTSAVAVTQPIAGLQASTTYHYRIVATNGSGTARDIDRTFVTPAALAGPAYLAAAAAAEGSGSDFAGMMWNGNASFPAPKETASSVKGTGAQWYRLLLYPEAKYESGAIDTTIDELAKRGITVLPYFGTGGEPGISVWAPFIQKEIKKYGPGGTFWAGKSYAKPMTWWEIGNEPNRGDNTPGGIPQPTNFGKFFAEAASAARTANSQIRVMFASMYSTAETTNTEHGHCQEVVCKMKIGQYIKAATTAINKWAGEHTSVPRGTYDAVGVHPYVFKVGENPITSATIPTVMKEVNGYVEEAHTASPEKAVWVTEFGWPTEYSGSEQNKKAVPPVSLQLQGELITAAFREFRAHEAAFKIARVFYYNLADLPNGAWPGACGLRAAASGQGSGGSVKRPGWTAFAEAANGDRKWPKPLSYGVIGEAKAVSGKKAKFKASLNNQGDGALVHFQFWKPGEGANPILTNTPEFRVEGDEIEQTFEQLVSGLQPSTNYMFHAVAVTDEGLTTVGESYSFTTPPSTSTSVKVRRILHGTPGYVWLEGNVKEGSEEGSLPGVAGAHVQVKLYLEGVYQRTVEVTTDATGHYETGYSSIAKGSWTATAEFPGGGELDRSESAAVAFHVRDGVQIVDSYSGGCLEVQGASTANGARIQRDTCGEPKTHTNQVFELVPVGNGQYLNIVPRNSWKCFDVVNNSLANWAEIQQYSCGSQTNQQFEENWWPETNYLSYRTRPARKCLEVPEADPGVRHIEQFECNGTPQQKFQIKPVEAS
jgi:hypothetical protein